MSDAELLAKYQEINPDPDALKKELDDLRMLKQAVEILGQQVKSSGVPISSPDDFLINASHSRMSSSTSQAMINNDVDRNKSQVDRINEALSGIPQLSDEDSNLVDDAL